MDTMARALAQLARLAQGKGQRRPARAAGVRGGSVYPRLRRRQGPAGGRGAQEALTHCAAAWSACTLCTAARCRNRCARRLSTV